MVLDSLEISITKQKCSKGNNELPPPPLQHKTGREAWL